MKTTEALIEFFIPGIWTFYPLSLIILTTTGLTGENLERVTDLFPNTTIDGTALRGCLFFGASYLSGIILSEIGTKIIGNRSNEIVHSGIKNQKDDLIQSSYEKLRDIKLCELTVSEAWLEFQYLRAFSRKSSEGTDSRVKSHESILRLLRPSILSIPLGFFLWSIYLLFLPNDYLNNKYVVSILLIGISIGSYFLIRFAYFSRLKTAVRSSIQHFAAIQSKENEASQPNDNDK